MGLYWLTMTDRSKIIFFDGDCILCNKAMRQCYKFDKKKIFHYSSIQSSFAKELLKDLHLDHNKIETIIYWENGKISERSKAIFGIVRGLGFPWSAVLIFSILPNKLTDYIYNLIAKNRKRFYRNSSCSLPEAGLKKRILEDAALIEQINT